MASFTKLKIKRPVLLVRKDLTMGLFVPIGLVISKRVKKGLIDSTRLDIATQFNQNSWIIVTCSKRFLYRGWLNCFFLIPIPATRAKVGLSKATAAKGA